MFKKLLVANRGEIAVRILRAAKEQGLSTVAVYSEEDAAALHVREADEAVCIGPAESQKSYLRVDGILEAAKKTKADAVHPGYGFLSENAKFAEACEKAKLTFVGPTSKMIDAMGDKVRSRETVAKNKVPTVPGTDGITDLKSAVQQVEKLQKARKDFVYPLLVKAAGGGGGKGMRIVRKPSELKENLERAQSESIKAFNNPMIFVERYIENPRHIEVQVLGDGKTTLHLYERECSLQRRHQKVVEEALSPSLDETTRKKILEAGVRAAESVGYKSAGTVEFIVSEQNDFFFLEMNTRIQVEHPVTEAITGIDLIEQQLNIAQGQKLKIRQSDIVTRGHAIEARLYAEDCDSNFLPQPGPLHFLRFPHWKGVRVDTGVVSPTKISSFYDPMIAKVIAWAPDRESCREKLKLFLGATEIEGLITNKAFLLEILGSKFFQKGRYHTHLLESADWRKTPKPSSKILAAFCLKDYLDNRIDFSATSRSAWQEAYDAVAN